jgi:glycosyltransferase involved in cell wall biosynthesis
MNLPIISIVTPSFNQANYLEETIDSVLSQNYPNLEYIIIDGGSSDGSVDIIRRFEKYLAYWVSEPDKGHGNALNKGFSQATGEIMAWLNSDDKYYPWTFKTIAEIFTLYNDVKWITGIASTFNEKGVLESTYNWKKNYYDYLTSDYKWIQQESTFWSRSLWEKAGSYIDESYKLMVDGELWSRFFQHERHWHINAVLGGFRKHSTNRGQINELDVDLEMNKVIENLYSQCNKENLIQLKEILNIFDKRRQLSKQKVYKLLPYFLFKKYILNYHKKEVDRFKISNNFAKYYTIQFINGQWEKHIDPMNLIK